MYVTVSDDLGSAGSSNQVVISSEQDRQVAAWVAVIQHLLDAERTEQRAVRWLYAEEMKSLAAMPLPGWLLRAIICHRICDKDFVVTEHSFDFRSSAPEDGYFIICRRPSAPLERPPSTSCSRSSYPPRFGH